MIGSILGDIIGSKYEFNNYKSKDFPLFSEGCKYSDDTVMTIAIYNALKEANGDYSNFSNILVKSMKELGLKYFSAGYGGMFKAWLTSESSQPYNSYGNGSAMRVSAVADFATSLEEAITLGRMTSEVTHNHPEGIKGAEVTAGATYLAKIGASKEEIRDFVSKYYDLNFDYADLVENYKFYVSCMRSVPQAMYCFLISNSYEDCMKTCVSIGGDSDTLCAIVGSVAEYYYGIPDDIKREGFRYLDRELLNMIKDEIKYDTQIKKH